MAQPLWQPSPDRIRKTQLRDFMQRMHERHGVSDNWESLRQWSIDRRDLFWAEMLEHASIEPSAPASATCAGEGMLGTTWFPAMKLNYARHMLRFDDDTPAIIHEAETGSETTLTHRELRAEVARCAAALKTLGVRRGDRVAGFMPNLPETLIAMLAAASLGAVWSSCSPDFGVGGVLDRFGQIEPKVLFTADGYSYAGKRFDSLGRIAEIIRDLPSVKRVVVVPYLGESATQRGGSGQVTGGQVAGQGPGTPPPVERASAPAGQTVDWASVPASDITAVRDALLWREFLGPATNPPPALQFEEVPFDHPLFIMYSSGTTGVPKCIVHGHGGTLLQHMKELMLHCDLRRGERIFYFTTCGWMMWNWLVSGVGVGAAVVLYEGNPGHPDMHRLWQLAERHKIHVFGISPKYIAACQKAGLHPGREHDLSALRAICSTGSPLAAEQFEWIYCEVKQDLQLSSISGGTDIISCFMLGNPILPVYAGEIQCRGLGMDVHAWNERCEPVIGEKGELVCTSPFPSQPVGFWNDPDGEKYRGAYFDHYDRGPGGEIWRHGDFIEITPRGGIIVYGRSDATLNPGGVRIGTAEIYRIVEDMPEITDSIVVGKPTADDVEICLFVVLREGAKLDEPLARRIRESVAARATKRHVPRHIRQVAAIPRTISGKKVELAVQNMLEGKAVTNRDALANPEALDEYRAIL